VVSGAIDRDVVSDTEQSDPAARVLAERVVRLRRDLNALYSQVRATSPMVSQRAEQWRRRVAEVGGELAILESRLASTRGAGGIFAPPIELDAARELIDPSTSLVQYFTARDEVLAIVVRRDRQRVHRHLVNARRLRHHVERLRFEILRPVSYLDRADHEQLVADARQELADLHTLLIEPLEESLGGTSRLLVCPHGPLHAVPFHALYDGARHLVETHEVTYAPSASLLRLVSHAARGAAAQADRRGLVLGFGDAAARLAEDEARAVAEALGDASIHVGAQATSERLAEEGRDAYVLHLACHARFVSQSPLASGLRLADGWMTIHDLYGVRIEGGAVVLSGCDTGRSAVGGADELVGLVSGFLAAGASTVMMSLWALNDEAARELLARVYQLWDKRPSGLAAALRTAQLETMRRRPHPLFWAPFTVLGMA
jgi:CHAT domain-containing protein